MTPEIVSRVLQNKDRIEEWLSVYEDAQLPFYLSADIRDGGFKSAVIDTNLYPAGFNNIAGLDDSTAVADAALQLRVPGASHIGLVIEEHTRNLWYLENVYALKTLFEKAGYRVSVFTAFIVDEEYTENRLYLKTQNNHELEVMHPALLKHSGIDLIILNNDLTNGRSEYLDSAGVPVHPPPEVGWHSRLKSAHFRHKADVLTGFCKIVDIDPWFFSLYDRVINDIDIYAEQDRLKLADAAQELFSRIEKKYSEEKIDEKPFAFIKADYGTYGMGLLPVEKPDDIINFNRKQKNRLHKGKGSKEVQSYLLQEGIPTVHSSDGNTAELVMYMLQNKPLGSFYRVNTAKSGRENLNSRGMSFAPFSSDDNEYNLYVLLARIAGVASRVEIRESTEKVNNEISVSG